MNCTRWSGASSDFAARTPALVIGIWSLPGKTPASEPERSFSAAIDFTVKFWKGGVTVECSRPFERPNFYTTMASCNTLALLPHRTAQDTLTPFSGTFGTRFRAHDPNTICLKWNARPEQKRVSTHQYVIPPNRHPRDAHRRPAYTTQLNLIQCAITTLCTHRQVESASRNTLSSE